ncbi:MAG: carboxylesterase family protein [Acidimicrobiales bacterium]
MTLVETSLGTLRGRERGGVHQFLGIPYAAPPIGDRRFRAPAPPSPWDGVLDATRLGRVAPQPQAAPDGPLPSRVVDWAEDCLFLNVYTPAPDDDRRPVLVWIHGGAYVRGSGDNTDGTSFAREGDLVVVTLNYRLGAFGFMELGHLDPELAGSGNNGIRDQIAALRWVHEHIARFGGDPERVTVCGESAGAGSVMALLAAPAADGLFHQAISQSAPAGLGRDEGATAAAILDQLGGGLAGLRAADAAEILAAQEAVAAADAAALGTSLLGSSGRGLRPVIDDLTVTRGPAEAVRADGSRPLLLGTNADEGTLFSFYLPRGHRGRTTSRGRGPCRRSRPGDRRVRAAHPDDSIRRSMVRMLGDTMFRTSSLQVAGAQVDAGGTVFVYRFTWAAPGFGGRLGSMHALEIPFVWKQDMAAWSALVGDDGWPPDLADEMHQAWIAFTRTGDPSHAGIGGWPRYDTTRRPTMEFGSTTGVVDDPDGLTRAAWT